MDASLQFPELYLKGDDFTGRDVTLTIRAIRQESLHSEKGDEDKIVMYFEETFAKAQREGRPKSEKRIVLSKSLYVDFVGMFDSKETDNWRGRVTFFRAKAVAGGKMVIRARAANQTEPQPPTTETK
jgi:hypothetical protein